MKVQEIKSLAVKRLALAAALEGITTWYADQISDQPSPIDWADVVDDLPPHVQRELDNITERMIRPAEYALLRHLVCECGIVRRHLYQTDKSLISEVRGHLVDALEFIDEGQIKMAYASMNSGRERLDWMLDGRKRDGWEIKRQIPGEILPRVRKIQRQMVGGLVIVGRAAAAA